MRLVMVKAYNIKNNNDKGVDSLTIERRSSVTRRPCVQEVSISPQADEAKEVTTIQPVIHPPQGTRETVRQICEPPCMQDIPNIAYFS